MSARCCPPTPFSITRTYTATCIAVVATQPNRWIRTASAAGVVAFAILLFIPVVIVDILISVPLIVFQKIRNCCRRPAPPAVNLNQVLRLNRELPSGSNSAPARVLLPLERVAPSLNDEEDALSLLKKTNFSGLESDSSSPSDSSQSKSPAAVGNPMASASPKKGYPRFSDDEDSDAKNWPSSPSLDGDFEEEADELRSQHFNTYRTARSFHRPPNSHSSENKSSRTPFFAPTPIRASGSFPFRHTASLESVPSSSSSGPKAEEDRFTHPPKKIDSPAPSSVSIRETPEEILTTYSLNLDVNSKAWLKVAIHSILDKHPLRKTIIVQFRDWDPDEEKPNTIDIFKAFGAWCIAQVLKECHTQHKSDRQIPSFLAEYAHKQMGKTSLTLREIMDEFADAKSSKWSLQEKADIILSIESLTPKRIEGVSQAVASAVLSIGSKAHQGNKLFSEAYMKVFPKL